MTTARDHFVRRFDLVEGVTVRCVGARRCESPAKFQIGWRFDQKIKGKKTVTVSARHACEKHARLFAFKHDLKIPGVGK